MFARWNDAKHVCESCLTASTCGKGMEYKANASEIEEWRHMDSYKGVELAKEEWLPFVKGKTQW